MPDVYNYDLVEAVGRSGCPLCRALDAAEQRAVATFLREGPFAPKARQRFFEAGGFCRRHAWLLHAQAVEQGSGAPIVDLYRNVAREDLTAIHSILHRLKERSGPRRRNWSLRRGDVCLLCEEGRESLERKADFFVEALAEERVRSLYTDSDGLCFIHLLSVLEAADETTAAFLLSDWHERLQSLEEL